MLPYALWSTPHCSPHGNAATGKAPNLADKLIGLLQSGLAGECWSLNGGACHDLLRQDSWCFFFGYVESLELQRWCGEAYGNEWEVITGMSRCCGLG